MRRASLLVVTGLSILGLTIGGCAGAGGPFTYAGLISEAARYNGETVTLEAFYFSGFEISVLSGSVGPATGKWRIAPTGTLTWVKGGVPQEVTDRLYVQTDTPSGYPETIGRLKVTGKFETGAKYGHLDAYSYQITVTKAELLEWTPPPAPTG